MQSAPHSESARAGSADKRSTGQGGDNPTFAQQHTLSLRWVGHNENETLAITQGRKWVGETAVRAVVTALPLYTCNRGLVVTNSTYAPGVRKVARAHSVVLRDRSWLERELSSFCVLCQQRVSWRVRNWCLERPEQFGGNVYCFDHQKDVRSGHIDPALAQATPANVPEYETAAVHAEPPTLLRRLLRALS